VINLIFKKKLHFYQPFLFLKRYVYSRQNNGVKKANPISEKQLYVLLYQHLFKVPLAYCSDNDEAMGVFNQSVLYIFSHLKSFDTETDLIKWCHRIIKNDCIDQLRKNAVYKKKLSIVGRKEDQWSVNEALSHLSMEEILKCVQKLDDALRLCFVMHELEGLTHKEIARQLNIKTNTAKWYFAEAKKALRILIYNSEAVGLKQAHSKF